MSESVPPAASVSPRNAAAGAAEILLPDRLTSMAPGCFSGESTLMRSVPSKASAASSRFARPLSRFARSVEKEVMWISGAGENLPNCIFVPWRAISAETLRKDFVQLFTDRDTVCAVSAPFSRGLMLALKSTRERVWPEPWMIS